MKVQLDHVTAEAADISSFHFVSEKPVSYEAGQYIELSLPLDGPDKPYAMRQFTLSSSPTEKFLTITTRLTDLPFKQGLVSLRPGDTVDMSTPIGDFIVPIDPSRPLIFIAGGIGITPFRSMLAWLADKGEQRNIRLIYAVRAEADIIFQDVFKRAGQHATIVVGKPSEAWGGERGQLTAELVLGLEKPTADSLLYLSGPEIMIEALSADLQAHGVAPDQIVTDLFLGYSTL